MARATAHELNQPLQIIAGYSYLILTKKPDENRLNDILDKIKRAVEDMGKITGKLSEICSYKTKHYVEGTMIIDIDEAGWEN